MDVESVPVYIVDDDPHVCSWIKWVVSSVGYQVETFSSADQFLIHDVGDAPHCLLVDLFLPGMTGLKLCHEIHARNKSCSFVVITGNGDVSSAVECMRLGAIDFLEKPFTRERLLDSVHHAVKSVRSIHERETKEHDFTARLATLTTREREVFDAVAAGHPTKVIAARWGISSRTIDVHRSRIMQKLGIESPMQLAHFIAMTLRAQTNSDSSAIA